MRYRKDEALLGRVRQQAERRPMGNYDPKAPPAQQFRNPVHCVERSNDGLIYVCDRQGDRVQVFRPDGTFVKEGSTPRRRSLRAPPGTSRFQRIAAAVQCSWPTARTRRCASSCANPGGDFEFRRRRAPARQFYGVHSIATIRRATSTRPRRTRKARAEIRLQSIGAVRVGARACCAAFRMTP